MSYVTNTGLTYYHSKMKTVLNGKSNTNHTHNYAGSTSPGGGANSVANSLSIQLNGGTATIFNGSAAKSINITPSGIGAANSTHTHDINALINVLSTGSATPGDNDYYISQDINNANQYVRRSTSAIWNYVKSKANTVYAGINHKHTYYGTYNGGDAGSGKTGYVKLMTINLAKANYYNQPIYLQLCSRGHTQITRVTIAFNNHATATSGKSSVLSFLKEGYDSAIYLQMVTDTSYYLWMKKSEEYDNITIYSYNLSDYMISAGIAVDFPNGFSATLPTTNIITPTWGNHVAYAEKANKTDGTLNIQMNGTTITSFNGSSTTTTNITPSAIGAAAASHSHPYLPLSGGAMTGSISMSGKDADIGLIISNTSTGKKVGFTIGTGNDNRGVYDFTGNKWMLYSDKDNNIRMLGNADSANKLITARTINGTNFDGTANITITANPTANQLTNQNLNDYKSNGFYFAGGGNTVVNKPDGVDAFGVVVLQNATGYREQVMVDTAQRFACRMFNSSAWGSWNYIYTTLNKPSKSDVGLGNVENKSSATIRGELTSSNVTTALGFTPSANTHTHEFIKNFVSGTATAGYIKVMDLDFSTTSNANQPMVFYFGQRAHEVTRLTILSNNFGSAAAVTIDTFKIAGGYMEIYLLKTADGKFSVYIHKAEPWDTITLYRVDKGDYMNKVKITYTDVFSSSLPSGTTQAGWGENVNYANIAGRLNNALTIQLNSGTTEGTNKFTYTGNAAKSLNITPSAIGASATSHSHDLSTMINTLSTGSANPYDNDYYVCQVQNGGTTNTQYIRRTTSAIWNYIKAKADTVYQPKGSYAAASHSHSVIWPAGNEPIKTTTDDTTANWGAKGISAWFYQTKGLIHNQPSQYGYLFNIGSGSEVHQLWMTQNAGTIYHRGGNGANGWGSVWTTLYDSNNMTAVTNTEIDAMF